MADLKAFLYPQNWTCNNEVTGAKFQLSLAFLTKYVACQCPSLFWSDSFSVLDILMENVLYVNHCDRITLKNRALEILYM